MFRITKTKLFVLVILISLGTVFRQEIRNYTKPWIKQCSSKSRKLGRNMTALADLVGKVPSSIKTIKTLNQKTYSTEKALEEIVPPDGRKKEKREYLGNYDPKKLEKVVYPNRK